MTTLGAELPECAGSEASGTTEGEGPPTSTPSALGDHYIDTLNGNAYVAVCTTGPVCWRQATGAGGGDLLAANNLSDVLSAVTSRLNLGLVIGVDVQAWTAVLQATTASYTAANATKLGGIEALADVTDAANVVPALAANTVNVDFNDVALLQVGPIEERIQTVAATGATETLDVSEYGWFDMTMDQACTFTFSNPAASGEGSSFYLELSGAFTPTFPASVDWGDATPPTYTTPTTFVFTTSDAGTTWLGTSPGKAFG